MGPLVYTDGNGGWGVVLVLASAHITLLRAYGRRHLMDVAKVFNWTMASKV